MSNIVSYYLAATDGPYGKRLSSVVTEYFLFDLECKHQNTCQGFWKVQQRVREQCSNNVVAKSLILEIWRVASYPIILL